MPVPPASMPPVTALPRALVEEVVDLACGLGADPGHLGEIGQCRALDRLERPEMVEQRALAGRADAGDFLQPRLADIAGAGCGASRPRSDGPRRATARRNRAPDRAA